MELLTHIMTIVITIINIYTIIQREDIMKMNCRIL